jgi:capsular exopolysaccharide synthesis family protein
MSKFFNETQKANQWGQQRLSSQELDVREMLESIKHGSAPATQTAEAQLTDCRQVHVGNGQATRLVLRQDQTSKPALEAYRALRTRLMRAQSKAPLKTIAITSALPGEGKTLTTMNLGLCCAQLPQQKVLVIDADLRTCGLTALLDQPGVTGLAEVLAGKATPDEAIAATNQKNFFVLPAGSTSAPPSELFSGARWQELLGRCSELFDVVLVDTPPIMPLVDFELISAACQGIVMIVRAHYAQRETMQKSASSVDRKKLVGLVLNGADANEKQYYGNKYDKYIEGRP